MHHSLKVKIWDLGHIESIIEQDITDVEAEKILGGTLSISPSPVILKKLTTLPHTSMYKDPEACREEPIEPQFTYYLHSGFHTNSVSA